VGGEGKGGRICLLCILDMYEYGTLKPVDIILRKRVGEEGE
jgi:hypothetical protein